MTLWGEYRRLHPDGYGYSMFCDLFGEWRLVHKGTMHLEHEPGDKLYKKGEPSACSPLTTSPEWHLWRSSRTGRGRKSTIIASQLPVAKWYEVIGESTIADVILDRMIHTAHRIELKGESRRNR